MEDTSDKQIETKKPSYKTLLIENIKYRTLLTEKYKRKKPWEKKNEKKLIAFIPGTIQQIYIKPRKRVKEGDKLLVLEAMKMKNDIVAPINGTIKSINVKVGDRVAKDELLIEFA
jgi:biotin carboxyl carrier protein